MKSAFKFLGLIVVMAMLLTACAPAATTAPTAMPAATTAPTAMPAATTAPTAMPAATTAPTAMPAATTAPTAMPAATVAPTAAASTFDYSQVGPELAAAFTGKYKGTVVDMAGPFTDQDTVKFNAAMADFEAKTGISVVYAGSKQFEASIRIDVEGGTPPDIADFPQPGLLASFASAGYVKDASTMVNPAWLKQNYTQAWLDLTTMPGKDGKPFTAGVMGRYNGKDTVWYPKAAFDAAGYKVPTTWADLMTLSNQIISDGDTPWCIGIESGAATGWPATDWIEALMLRTTTPANYDAWVAGKLKFDSPEVRKAISYMTPIWLNDKMVYGGVKSISTVNFGDSIKPMFDNPPKCWLQKQGNFITSFMPTNLVAGKDYDFFYLPTIDSAEGTPFEVAGDIYAAFNDRPEVRAVLQYFSMGESLKTWALSSGALAPQKDFDPAWYTDPVSKKLSAMVAAASVVRFDGSDAMPGAVGAGSFWKEMTSWISGGITLDTALKEIDASWPPPTTK